MSVRKREREAAERQALARVRGRILSGLHAGHLDPGDRLSSYRELAAQTGLDLRAVGRIYEALAEEGFVEVRGKAGVYVASQERIGGRVLAETARWAVSIFQEGLSRRIPVPQLPEFMSRCVGTIPLRCACVESTKDQLVSMCTELHDDFGLATSPIHIDSLHPASKEDIPARVRNAHLLVTTAFHAALVREIAEELEKPLVLIRLDADLTLAVERHLQERPLTVICVDPRFIERLRDVFGGAHPDHIHPVLTSERQRIARLDPHEPVLVSRAARRKLRGVTLPPSLLPPSAPIVSIESASELIELILRLNVEAMRHRTSS